MQDWLNICQSFSVIDHIKTKEEKYTVFSVIMEKLLIQINAHLWQNSSAKSELKKKQTKKGLSPPTPKESQFSSALYWRAQPGQKCKLKK